MRIGPWLRPVLREATLENLNYAGSDDNDDEPEASSARARKKRRLDTSYHPPKSSRTRGSNGKITPTGDGKLPGGDTLPGAAAPDARAQELIAGPDFDDQATSLEGPPSPLTALLENSVPALVVPEKSQYFAAHPAEAPVVIGCDGENCHIQSSGGALSTQVHSTQLVESQPQAPSAAPEAGKSVGSGGGGRLSS